jgi:hypothetical protein
MSFTVINDTLDFRYVNTLQQDDEIFVGNRYSIFDSSQKYYEIEKERFGPRIFDVRGNTKKILFSVGIGPYNFFYLSVPAILKLHRAYPDAVLIIDYSLLVAEKTDKTFVPFLSKMLDSVGAKYQFIEGYKIDGVVSNNHISANVGNVLTTHNVLLDSIKLARAIAQTPDVEPHKLVYVSRKNTTPRHYNIKPGLSTNVDCRVYNEDILESYLKDHGFEVVYPEDFKTMEDQINYFNQAKVLLSVSSSGMAHMMFMQDKTTVVEFVTSYPRADDSLDPESEGDESLHHLYHKLAYLTNKTYIGFANYTRQAEDIIGIIESSKLLQKLIG